MACDGALLLAPGKPRTLAFQHSARKDLRLLEVDEGLLQELLSSGLNIKGEEGEEAVLCTQDQTLAIKTVETTNSVWLVQPNQGGVDRGEEDKGCQQLSGEVQSTPPGQLVGLATQMQRNKGAAARAPVMVTALASSHLELVPAAPRLHNLDALLQERPYGGEGDGEGMEVDGTEGSGQCSGRYTRAELLQRVQASPAELDRALEERHALCLDGQYCSVDPEYLGTLLEMLLLTAVEQGWAQEHVIPAQAAADALAHSGYNPSLVRHCLKVYGSRVSEENRSNEEPSMHDSSRGGSGSGSGSDLWWLSEGHVCRHFARKLLGCQPQWQCDEFLEAWRGSVPEAMLPDLEMLRGEALVWGQAVKRFPVDALPADAAGRFAALFRERERWLWEDLAPYVEGLQGPGQTVEGLLLKFTRATQPKPSDPIMYSAR